MFTKETIMSAKRSKKRFVAKDFQVSPMCDLSQPSPQCVQVARKDGTVAVRSSKTGGKKTLQFDHAEWKAFIDGVKAGAFDV